MKHFFSHISVIFFLFIVFVMSGQNISQLKSMDIDSLSDNQITKYWEGVQQKGYSLDQFESIAISQGVSEEQFSKFKYRVQNLRFNPINKKKDKQNLEGLVDTLDIYGLTGNESKLNKKINPLFGYDFFSNPKISFKPNMSGGVPDNYQLGPGDEISIDLWGAAEINYKSKVNNQGAIYIEGIGRINVNNISFENATKKINAYLKKKHSGINSPASSYDKIYTNIALSKYRTVQVNIIGEVKVPGSYSLSAMSNILNALYASGGPTERGTFRNIKLIRKGIQIATFDVYKYLTEGSEEGNMKVKDQDVIIVGAYENQVEVKGEVKRPGLYELKKGETLRSLSTYFSGFTSNAYTDLLIVERVNGQQRAVKEVKFTEANSFIVKNGDKISVGKIVDKYTNRVQLKGAVYRPGDYELVDEMTLYDLLNKANGVTEEAFLNRGILIRTYNTTEKEYISFSVKDILNKTQNISLSLNDKVEILRKDKLEEEKFVTIEGAVNKEIKIEYAKNIQIEDVIAMAGGLKEGGDASKINVSRRLKDGSFKTLSANFSLSVSNTLENNEGSPFYLKPYDIVFVRYLKGYTPQVKVKIEGEVKYKGKYSLSTKNERISDLIKRAGGLTEFAYPEGAYLIRKVKSKEEKKQLELIQDVNKKESLTGVLSEDNESINPIEIKKQEEFKVGINLSKILALNGAKSGLDLFLKEGDEIFIPSKKQTVKVIGEIMSPSLVRFEKGKKLKDYISRAGGFSFSASKRKVYVVSSNGDIEATSSFLFFKSFPKVSPGSTIYVPTKTERKGMSAQETLAITTSLGTLALLIQNLTK